MTSLKAPVVSQCVNRVHISRLPPRPAAIFPARLHRCLLSGRCSRLVRASASTLEKSTNKTEPETKEVEVDEWEEDEQEDGDEMGLTTKQVEGLLSVLCEKTKIAEVELKMGSFELKVRRSLKNGSMAGEDLPAAAAAAPAAASLDMAPLPLPEMAQSFPTMDEDDLDESLVYIASPKVGLMRRGKYFKGKKVGKGSAIEVGDRVKQGQPLCYIEQLGTFVVVEAPQAGEVTEILVDEGGPVEYNQPLVELAPYFGGHIIGDKKFA